MGKRACQGRATALTTAVCRCWRASGVWVFIVRRRVTKLPPALHVQVMRQIKRARQMALIPGEARPEKRHVRALREMEARLAVTQQ